MRWGGWIGASLLSAALACSSTPSSCPTIACEPTISLQFRQPVSGSYMATIVFQDVTYPTNCPSPGPISDTPPRISCDGNGITTRSASA